MTNSKLDGWCFSPRHTRHPRTWWHAFDPFSSFVQTRLDPNAHLTIIATTIEITLLQLKYN
jgi:hypothetical protein